MKISIEAKNLSKSYMISTGKRSYSLFKEKILNSFSGFKDIVSGDGKREKYWALKNVNFKVEEGEIIGILGPNGAGKSTLLKILSRITIPSEGEVKIHGRVSSLLEVGAGFHPELTGRENIYLNSSILGMRKEEVESRFDDIVDFSGVGHFLDTPVKYFSSGMYLRLAFSIAANLISDILLVDEILSVGDIEFQKKCVGKIGDLISQKKRTVVIVSHDMGLIKKMCSRCLVLDKGSICFDGQTNEAVKEYIKIIKPSGNVPEVVFPKSINSNFVFLKKISLSNENGKPKTIFPGGGTICLSIDIYAIKNIKTIISLSVKNDKQIQLMKVISEEYGQSIFLSKGMNNVKITLRHLYLSDGEYSISLWIGEKEGIEPLDEKKNCVSFVMDNSNCGSFKTDAPLVANAEWIYNKRGGKIKK